MQSVNIPQNFKIIFKLYKIINKGIARFWFPDPVQVRCFRHGLCFKIRSASKLQMCLASQAFKISNWSKMLGEFWQFRHKYKCSKMALLLSVWLWSDTLLNKCRLVSPMYETFRSAEQVNLQTTFDLNGLEQFDLRLKQDPTVRVEYDDISSMPQFSISLLTEF